MRKQWIIVFCILLTGISFRGKAQGCLKKGFPEKKNQLIYDSADMLSGSEEQLLETKLRNYNDTTGTQIIVLTVRTSYCDLALAATELGHVWGVGQEKEDNGIVILVDKNNRQLFIATGYGIEGYIPDAYAKRIVENILKPNFRNERYYNGLDKATDVMFNMLAGLYVAPEEEPSGDEGIPGWLIFLIIVIILILLMNSRRRKQYEYYRGGKRTYDGDWGQNSGDWGDFKRGGGVFRIPTGGGWGGGSGGGWGGGSSGGGGFGGFGGGGFGGGGAGGSW